MNTGSALMWFAASACAAVALLWGSARAGRLVPSRRGQDQLSHRVALVIAGIGLFIVLLVGVGGALAKWAAFIVAAGELIATSAWLLTRQAVERQGVSNEHKIIKACGMIAGQLEAGEIPAQAMLNTAEDVPLLASVAGTIQIGGDVPAELHFLAGRPGCSGLDWLARSWQLCERTGMPLSPVIRRLSDTLRQQGIVRDQRRAELASAKSTSRLLAGLPAIGMAMGFFVGADPIEFLTDSLAGHLCLVCAASLISGGLIWTQYLTKEQ